MKCSKKQKAACCERNGFAEIQNMIVNVFIPPPPPFLLGYCIKFVPINISTRMCQLRVSLSQRLRTGFILLLFPLETLWALVAARLLYKDCVYVREPCLLNHHKTDARLFSRLSALASKSQPLGKIDQPFQCSGHLWRFSIP